MSKYNKPLWYATPKTHAGTGRCIYNQKAKAQKLSRGNLIAFRMTFPNRLKYLKNNIASNYNVKAYINYIKHG